MESIHESIKVINAVKLDECFTNNIVSAMKKQQSDEAFYMLDLNVVTNLMATWKRNLPMVQHFYAVKCNPNPDLLATLARRGSSFDCASPCEISSILALGVSPDRIIYANTCKAASHIKYAAEVGVNLTTFDTLDEVEKIRKWHPECCLLIRIQAPDESGCQWPLGSKFGALPNEVTPLLMAAQSAGLKVSGVSFHIGSVSHNFQAYNKAIEAAKEVFKVATSLCMAPMHVLKVGGGFVCQPSLFEAQATAVRDAIETYFSKEERRGLSVIAEPGTFFARSPFTLVMNIIGKRVRGDIRHYWINEGIYGSLNLYMLAEHNTLLESLIALKCTSNNGDNDTETSQGLEVVECGRYGGGDGDSDGGYMSTVFGPTMDSIDKVMECELQELDINDWLVFRNMGAYAAACATNFNGFRGATITILTD